jgi:DNA-binding CsgD family transcriptional regulator
VALTLSSRDVERFVAMQRTLLAPLEYERVEHWCVAVLRDVEALFDGNRSAMLMPLADRLVYLSESIAPEFLSAFENRIERVEPGQLHVSDSSEDHSWTTRRASRLNVWNVPMLARLNGQTVERWPAFQECIKPAGIMHGPVMTTSLPNGEAFVGVANSQPDKSRFSEASSLALMRMLLPCFQAGVNLATRLHDVRTTLGSLLDALGEPIALFDRCCRKVHVTPAWVSIVDADPERELVEATIRDVLAQQAFLFSERCDSATALPSTRIVATATARYRVYSSWARRSFADHHDVMIVRIERLTPSLPSQRDLMARYCLTKREADIVLLLAEGLSNKVIATRLSVSTHTVRHHTEAVFAKLGVHTRKALALDLLRRRL